MVTTLRSHYEQDYYGWLQENVALLRKGKLAEIDIDNIAEELEDMSRSQRQQLLSRLAILIAHFLKWEFQPARRSNSWRATIRHQRLRVKKLLQESPSLKYILPQQINEAYEEAVLLTAEETARVPEDFPDDTAYTLEQLLDDNFFPD